MKYICLKAGRVVSVIILSCAIMLSFADSALATGCGESYSSDRSSIEDWKNKTDSYTYSACGKCDKVNPKCGSADGKTFESEPTSGLCSEGSAINMKADGEDGWSWKCALSNSSKKVTCSAHKEPIPEPEPEPEPEPTPEPKPTPEPEPEPEPEPKEEDDDNDDKDKKCDKDSSIGDLVWHDRNKNGIRDANEEGLSGITVKLHRGNDTEKDNTGAKGQYEFDDLCKGKYTVVVDTNDLGKGCYPTYDKDGDLDHKTVIHLDRDEDYEKADFGYYCPSGPIAPRTGAGGVALAISGCIAGLATYITRKRLF